ncbi:PadR family transcriptional regulator [Vibrio parahaemolyticus]|uniref:PadR family transcriptional regulator n=1 Tax=Vibrio parahaemolyticus TaxID=670 RepID=UPI0015DED9BC|nr:PadR family transcriptional regulator [Vibrio parahaemolyticus]MBE3985689.1 PadR family transcriptional regulator [Vibrio parahaemolyticus]MBE4286463.1 PadR family transcriptional regulator [Vibrio parahaemolyticus]MDF4901749.1 PadR family transcriptional regulator [Vibrio parahaemolyticus]HCG7330503.1 PadR family transcriptional regulator [Vibrio parahaemolyticus]HCG8860044.1 PadR family transcriptional regulator [Vibrio parahaemolyticus]
MSKLMISNTLDQAILTELDKAPLTGYDLTKLLPINTGWKASHQQIYRQCNKMAAEGVLEFTEVTNEGKPDSKLYRMTDVGKAALREMVEGEQFKLQTFRNKATVMLAAGSASYFISASEALSLAVNAISERLNELRESIDSDNQVESMNLELELGHKQADLDFANRAKDLLCAK